MGQGSTIVCIGCRDVLADGVGRHRCADEIGRACADAKPVRVFADRSGCWHGQITNPDGSVALAFAPADLDDAVLTAERFMGRELDWSVAPTGTIEAS